MAGENYRTVIKRQHRRHRELLVLLGTVSVGLVLVLGFILGQQAAYSGMASGGATAGNELPPPPSVVDPELSELRQQRDILKLQGEMDRAALELVRLEIAQQKEKISKLEEGLAFYQGLMAPEQIAPGFSLRKLELLPTESSAKFVFRLVAQQATVKHTTLKGSLTIELYGMSGNELRNYALAELSEDFATNTIPLRFRYFQEIEGELELPDNFVPQGFTVVASSKSPHKIVLREDYPWEVQTRFSYVGN